jgi:hypothetical protein
VIIVAAFKSELDTSATIMPGLRPIQSYPGFKHISLQYGLCAESHWINSTLPATKTSGLAPGITLWHRPRMLNCPVASAASGYDGVPF